MMLEFSDTGGNDYNNWQQNERNLASDPSPAPPSDPAPAAPGNPFDEPRVTTSYSTAPGGEDSPDPFQTPPDQQPGGVPPANTPGGGSSTYVPPPPPPPEKKTDPTTDPLAGYSAVERDFLQRNRNPDGSYDVARMAAALSNNTGSREFDSQSGYYNNDGTLNAAGRAALAARTAAAPPSGPASPLTVQRGPGLLLPAATGSPAFANTSPMFSDPASSLLENYALDQFGNRLNPDPNSGTALFEKYARELIDTLRQPVYSPQDEAIIKTKANDAIEQERDATKQRWLEELSRRGITPSSGVALDGLLQIENHFNGLRTQVEANFAADAISRTRDQRVQVLDTAAKLSAAEEARLQDAGTYARVPYDLANQAFQRNLQLVGAGGSPADLVGSSLNIGASDRTGAQLTDQSAMARAQLALAIAQAGSGRQLSLAQLQQQNQLLQSGDRSAQTAALLQLLGYMFG